MCVAFIHGYRTVVQHFNALNDDVLGYKHIPVFAVVEPR
jgi:hypothetical protein